MATYIVQPFHAIWTACSSRYRNLPLYMTLTVYVREALIFSMLFTYIYVSNDHDINRDPRFQLIEICLFSFCCSFFFYLCGTKSGRINCVRPRAQEQKEAGATSVSASLSGRTTNRPVHTNGATVALALHPARAERIDHKFRNLDTAGPGGARGPGPPSASSSKQRQWIGASRTGENLSVARARRKWWSSS